MSEAREHEVWIAPGSICRTVFTRAYAEPLGRGGPHTHRARKRVLPALNQTVAFIDTETVNHRLTFGVVERCEGRQVRKRVVFYRDDLPTDDPAGFAALRRFCLELGVELVSREWVFRKIIWPARRSDCWTISGFNVTYDASRFIDDYGPATQTSRQGARFCGGFAFKKNFATIRRTRPMRRKDVREAIRRVLSVSLTEAGKMRTSAMNDEGALVLALPAERTITQGSSAPNTVPCEGYGKALCTGLRRRPSESRAAQGTGGSSPRTSANSSTLTAPALHDDCDKDGVYIRRTFMRIKRDDRHHVRYDMKGAAVLDVATWAYAHTDRNHTLASACKAFGVPFEDRPGLHSGEITKENVAGCLYDVDRTRELCWAVEREHQRHPIDLHPTKTQSGAALAKAHLDAMNIHPRQDVQPDFPKEYLGFAAQAYIGGRVEAILVNQPFPCAFDDYTSMYVTGFSLTDLWQWVIAERLEVVDVDPAEIVALLESIRRDPSLLLDPATWPRLAFFALVLPHGETLPARVALPTQGVSRREQTAEEAMRRYEESMAADGAYWDALDGVGGKIIPDERYDPRKKRWIVVEGFENLRRGLVRRNAKKPMDGYAHGNIDEIAQSVRDATGDDALSTSDVLEFFSTHDRPSIVGKRREARDNLDPNAPTETSFTRCITVGPVHSEKIPLWYAGHDLAAAAIAGGVPAVLKAWRLRPVGVQSDLQPICVRGDEHDRIDPNVDDFWRCLIERRKRKSTLSDEEDRKHDEDMRKTGYKCIALSGAYGIFAETNAVDVDPDEEDPKPRRIRVYADETYNLDVNRPERHGRYAFFPIASLVTAAARLLLALYFKLIEDAGGTVGYCDTDSGIVVASEHGGLVPCEGGPHRMPDGRPAVMALSWAQLDAIRARINALNPYDQEVVGDAIPSLLKEEDENFEEVDGKMRRRQLYCYAASEKLYALFTLDAAGNPLIAHVDVDEELDAPIASPSPGVQRSSAFGLGALSSPVPYDRSKPKERTRWIKDVWARQIAAVLLGERAQPFKWESYPATTQFTATTFSVIKPYADNERRPVRPFDFLVAGIIDGALGIDAFEGRTNCPCDQPRPVTMRLDDPSKWHEQEWFCLRCGRDWPLARRPRLRTYGAVVRAIITKSSRKRLCSDGSEGRDSRGRSWKRGLTIPRPVHVQELVPIGKETRVVPSEDELVSAEGLGAAPTLDYPKPVNLDELRAQIRACRVRKVHRMSSVALSAIDAFLNRGSCPHLSTIAKLREAVVRCARPEAALIDCQNDQKKGHKAR